MSGDVKTTIATLRHQRPREWAALGQRDPPHVFVTVEADTLRAMANLQAARTLDLDLKPADLEGFGPVGSSILKHLMRGAEITPFLIKTIGKNTEVLDVGRTERRATPRQAKAVRLRQHGVCAAPGCKHPISHHHHTIWWSNGGPTDLDLLIGLCRKCHTPVHAGRLKQPAAHRSTHAPPGG
ncbi:MAG: HNH endonuclease [Aeromicrobium sp.]